MHACLARYLFVPLAEAVVFAMIASYFVSRTLVATLAMYLLKKKEHTGGVARNPLNETPTRFRRGTTWSGTKATSRRTVRPGTTVIAAPSRNIPRSTSAAHRPRESR